MAHALLRAGARWRVDSNVCEAGHGSGLPAVPSEEYVDLGLDHPLRHKQGEPADVLQALERSGSRTRVGTTSLAVCELPIKVTTMLSLPLMTSPGTRLSRIFPAAWTRCQ